MARALPPSPCKVSRLIGKGLSKGFSFVRLLRIRPTAPRNGSALGRDHLTLAHLDSVRERPSCVIRHSDECNDRSILERQARSASDERWPQFYRKGWRLSGSLRASKARRFLESILRACKSASLHLHSLAKATEAVCVVQCVSACSSPGSSTGTKRHCRR